ncbi:MAG: hypothetical protein PHS92_04345 [Candidatus Gracilibacteria bacterium]|nr:hypothetical protein [Candidatus Gracilibacteria bacterium]
MYIFFLIINIIFSSIFYIFSQAIESVIFLILGFILFIYFSPFYFGKKDEDKPKILTKLTLKKENFVKMIPKIQKASYFIAFLFFYMSLYGISYSFEGNLFSIFTLIISLALTGIFFHRLKEDKNIIFLLFRSNFLVFSILYFIFFIIYLFDFSKVDIIFFFNSFLSLFGLFSILVFDRKYPIFKKNMIYIYLLFYILIFTFFYLSFLFNIPNTILFLYIGMIYSIVFFEYMPKIKHFAEFMEISKYFGTILNYIVIITAMILLFLDYNLSEVITILIIGLIFNLYIHVKFQNYISYSLILLTSAFLYIKFFGLDHTNLISAILFIFVFPIILMLYSFLVKMKYFYDNYFLHYFGIIFSLIGIIYYIVMSRDFDILHISILLLLESMLFFTSFVKLKKQG